MSNLIFVVVAIILCIQRFSLSFHLKQSLLKTGSRSFSAGLLPTNRNLKLQLKSTSLRTVSTTDNKLDIDLIATLTVYFVQGALGLSRLALSYFMKDELHLTPAELAAFSGLAILPWVIKPFYGFLSDGLPLFGYKRRSYLIGSGICGFLSWVSLGLFVSTPFQALIANIIASASVAVSDVVIDSIVVEKSRDSPLDNNIDLVNMERNSTEYITDMSVTPSHESTKKWNSGDLQSYCWGASAIGGILSAYFSGSLLEHIPPRSVFLISSFFPLLVSIVSYFIIEQKVQTSQNINEFIDSINNKTNQLKETLMNKSIYLPIFFICLWKSTPSPDTAMFYFSTNELGFSPEFLGRVSLVGSIASFIGVLSYRTWLKNISIKKIIYWSTLISIPLGLTQVLLTTHWNRDLGIPDTAFVLTDTVVLTVLGQVSFMPTLVLAAKLCPPGVEGTLFATLMSLYNAASSLGTEFGAALTSLLGITDTNFKQLTLLIIICNLSSLLPLPFINLMDVNDDIKDDS